MLLQLYELSTSPTFSISWNAALLDEVFNVGLAKEVLLAGDARTRLDPSRQYGTGGKMQGKKFMICATWNAPREAFDNPDVVLYTRQRNCRPLSPHHFQLQVHRLRHSPGLWGVRYL
jgi:putative NADPH-quinone reductase